MAIQDYLRCIDCDYFGHHGAYCDIIHEQVVCFCKACVLPEQRQAEKAMLELLLPKLR